MLFRSVDVTVTALGGTSSTAGTGNDYRFVAVPMVDVVAPASGPIAGGQSVTLTGTNFVNVTSVTFDGVTATVLPGGTETSLTVMSPAHAIGTVEVRVTAAGGSSSTAGAGNDYRYYGVPTITSLSPVRGPLGGTTVTITGTNLLGVTAITFEIGRAHV